ncbi:four-carbon acid sugar kinase family protein [Rhodoplanes sp.]
MLLGRVADDLTGATDLALVLTRAGLPTAVAAMAAELASMRPQR